MSLPETGSSHDVAEGRSHADTLRHALESAGLKYTRQREAVYGSLRETLHHPTAEEVFQGVKVAIPSISLATVYKSLEALTACGLATKLSDAEGSARYDARPDHHYHLRCLKSGQVADLPTHYDPSLIDRLDPEIADHLSRIGFKMTGYRLELVGYFDGDAQATVQLQPDSEPTE